MYSIASCLLCGAIEVAKTLTRAAHVVRLIVLKAKCVIPVAHNPLAAPDTLNANLSDGGVIAARLCAIFVDDASSLVDCVAVIVGV